MAKSKKKAAKKRKPALKKKAIKRAVKRKTAPKASKKKVVARKKKAVVVKKLQEGTVVGRITHYFPHVQAAVIKLKAPLSVGNTIKVKGHTTDFTQTITSMQIDHLVVNSAKKGDEIGLQVNSRVRQHDTIYKI